MSDKFSRLDLEAKQLAAEIAKLEEVKPKDANGFDEKLLTPKWRKYRKTYSKRSFEYFSRTYFPPEVHRQGYFKPGRLQLAIPEIATKKGLHLILGPRGYGKTVTALMTTVWLFLTHNKVFFGTYSETMDKARALMRTIANILRENTRINQDWGISIESENDDELVFKIAGNTLRKRLKPYSPGRSMRGAVAGFDRPEFILADDVETESSSLEPEIVAQRLRKLEEALKSLADGGTFIILANNFNEECAGNKLLIQQDDGKLAPGHTVHVFPAWSDVAGPLWSDRYPAKTEEELQQLHQADDEEWSGNFQQRPEALGGFIFPKQHFELYDELPYDARGITYCDPNLALNLEISDTTAMGGLLYSPEQNCFYAYRLRCKAFGDSDELLNGFLDTYDPQRIKVMAFDGHVNQEAIWTNMVRNWAIRHQRPYPPIDYRRYDVDLHAKTASMIYHQGRIKFPRGWIETEEGQRFYKQIIRFKGKKNKRKGQRVDAADWLICAFQYIHEPEIAMGEGYGYLRKARMKRFDYDVSY